MTATNERRINATNTIAYLHEHADPTVSDSCEFLLAALRPDLTQAEVQNLLRQIRVAWRRYLAAAFPGDRANAYNDYCHLINGAANNPTTITKDAAA